MKFYDLITDVSVPELWLYGEIGEDIWGEGVAAKELVSELATITAPAIDVHINSPGGSVWDGQAIYNALARHRATVTTYVDGLAASIASLVAMAGDSIVMAENALMMIHDPWALTVGNAAEHRDAAAILDKVAGTIRAVYAARTGRDEDDIGQAMAAETWFTASEAIDFGLADSTDPALPMAALAVDATLLAKFKHPPATLIVCAEDDSPAPSGPDPGAADDEPDEGDEPSGETTEEPVAVAPVHDFRLDRIRLRR